MIKGVLIQIFDVCEQPIEQKILVGLCYNLFDQSHFGQHVDENFFADNKDNKNNLSIKVNTIVENLIEGLTPIECKIILDYLFSENPPSMEELSSIYKLPKSTIHYKISTFKKKIQSEYVPDNQSDGENFVKFLYEKLDKIANI